MNHQLINSRRAHYSGIVYSGESFGTHFHNSYELIYVMDGDIDVTIGEKVVKMNTGELILISSCAVHSIKSEVSSKIFIAIIAIDYISDFYNAHKNEIAIRFCMDDGSIRFISEKMIMNKCSDSYVLKACLYLILSFAARGEVLVSAKSVDHSFVYTVNSYISEHFTERVTRADLARLVGCEEHYFSSLFHRHFGMNLRKYLNMYRVSHACGLLQSTEENISCIAFDSGFSSIREFNTVFAELMGMTPKEFRMKKGKHR